MNPISSGLSPSVLDVLGAGQLDTQSTQQRVESVGVELESVFLSMMIKEMRNSLDNGGFFGEESSDTYGGMFDLFIGKHLAESKPLGISELLLEQYNKSKPVANDSSHQRSPTSLTA